MKRIDKKPNYSISVKCSNCDHIGTVEIPYGEPVSGRIECPNCGCMTASKHHTVSSLPSWRINPTPWPSSPAPWYEDHPQRKYPFDVTCDYLEVSKRWDNNGRGPEFGPA